MKTYCALLLLPLWFLRGAPTYPGPAPGPVHLELQDGRIVLRNRALTATWPMGQGGLPATLGRPTDSQRQPQPAVAFSGQSAQRFVRDAQTRQTFALTGEVFQIVLANGQRLAASALEPEGEPRLSELTPELLTLGGWQMSAFSLSAGCGWRSVALGGSPGTRFRVR